MKISVFDSGLGGITVLKKLLQDFPNNEYIYYADLKNLPYGDKSENELKEIGKNIIHSLDKYNTDLYIVACGTLSSNALEEMTEIVEKKNKKIIGIIDSISNRLKKTNSKNALLIATPATIRKGIFKEKLQENNPQTTIYTEGCTEFVEMIEAGNKTDIELQNIVNKYIEKYVGKIDTIICGCTHYILLEKYIENTLPNVNIIEAGLSIEEEIANNIKDSKPSLKILMSKENKVFKDNVKNILYIDNDDLFTVV
ncbi:MAG: glutamate racemase [Clostridia bacterium]|nr:glutamate racemase [Clostridia bacterium]